MKRDKVTPTVETQDCPWCGQEKVRNGTACPVCGTSIPAKCKRSHRMTLDDLQTPVTQAQIDAEYNGIDLDDEDELPILDELGDVIPR